jgi:hypothetical protein
VTLFATLTEAWAKVGLDEGLLPKRTSETIALNRAITAQREKHCLVRKLKTMWSVVRERVDADEDPTYNVELKVGFDDKGGLEFDPPTHKLVEEIKLAYDRALGDCWSTQEISDWLTGLAIHSNAVSLRDMGGVYYIPPIEQPQWENMVNAIEAASGHRISIIPALASRHAIKAVLAGIQAEAQKELEAFQKTLEADELGQRGYVAQADKCGAVEKKLEYYEGFLGETLETFRKQLEEARANLVIASFRKAAENDAA